MTVPDVIDHLAGVAEGSTLDVIRRQRLQARDNAQNSYRALFEAAAGEGLSRTERFAVAAFVAGLHGTPRIRDFYDQKLEALAGSNLREVLEAAIEEGTGQGPYGSYPPGPLSAEDRPGAAYRILPAHRDRLGQRLAAALDHAHLLVLHPRDASSAHLQALIDAGFSTTEIVTLSQLVAFPDLPDPGGRRP